MPGPIDILLEVGMNADAKRGIDYYAENIVNGLAACDPKNRYTIFTYFFRDYEAKKARLPNPRRGNFELVVRRAPERIVHPLEWGLKLPVIEKCLLPKRPYKVYHVLTGGTLPHLSGPKGISTFFDLATETKPEDRSAALGPGNISDPFICDVARRSDYLVATSHKTRENLTKYYSIAEEKIKVIHSSIDPEVFHTSGEAQKTAVREKYGLPSRYMMLIGPYVPPWRTNAEYVLRAYARLKTAGVTKDCRLVFVGAKNDYLERLFSLGSELGVREDLFATGFVGLEDLPAIYALSDAVVHPTSGEGFGYGIEVFASGAPFITSNVPGVLESVADCALTVPPQEVEPLANAMGNILTQPDLREKLRRAGLARAPRFSNKIIAEQMVELYETAAREHGK